MSNSTWTGFFKRSHPPDEASPTVGTQDTQDGQRGVQVAFESLHYEDGQPFIALVFLCDGVPIAPSGRVFTFELAPGNPNPRGGHPCLAAKQSSDPSRRDAGRSRRTEVTEVDPHGPPTKRRLCSVRRS
jgi:hypothetical protein